MNEGNSTFLYKAKASKKDKAAAKRERHHTQLSKRGGVSKASLKRKKPVYDRPFDYGNPEKNEVAMRPVSADTPAVPKGVPLPAADIDAIMADGATAKEIKRQQRQEARRLRLRETETLAANLDDLLEPLKAENEGRTRVKLDHTPNPRNTRGNEAIIKAETKRFNKIMNSSEYQASPFASLQAFLKTQIPQKEPQHKDKKMHM